MQTPKRAHRSIASEGTPIPFFDNNVLQCFGAARDLHLLKVFQPAFTTSRVEKEQRRTAPKHARTQFEDALASGWLTIHAPARTPEIRTVCEQNMRLSQTDAELFILAQEKGEDLFTDENELYGVAKDRGVAVYDVPETVLLLEELGVISAAHKKSPSSTSTPRTDASSRRESSTRCGSRDSSDPSNADPSRMTPADSSCTLGRLQDVPFAVPTRPRAWHHQEGMNDVLSFQQTSQRQRATAESACSRRMRPREPAAAAAMRPDTWPEGWMLGGATPMPPSARTSTPSTGVPDPACPRV